jgi:hypothetical protein
MERRKVPGSFLAFVASVEHEQRHAGGNAYAAGDEADEADRSCATRLVLEILHLSLHAHRTRRIERQRNETALVAVVERVAIALLARRFEHEQSANGDTGCTHTEPDE